MENPLVNIDGEAIERTVTDMYKTMQRSIRLFSDIPAVQKVAIDVRNSIEEFKPLVPLIQAVRSPGMRERHWEQFKEETAIEIVIDPNLTFSNCLEMGIDEHSEYLSTVADNASKEYSIEIALDKMEAEWEEYKIELTPYKSTGEDLQDQFENYLLVIISFRYLYYESCRRGHSAVGRPSCHDATAEL